MSKKDLWDVIAGYMLLAGFGGMFTGLFMLLLGAPGK
jgi:hypothetical protein